MKYSGSSGIRMEWGTELINTGKEIALALSKKYKKIVIGSDFRESSDALTHEIAGALLSSGSDVYYAGKLPTPSLAYAAKDYDGGIMITASHNPPEYNGIKLWNPDGSAFSENQMEELDSTGKISEWHSTGKFSHVDAVNPHRDAIIERTGRLNGLKIVMDCSNGASAVISPYVLRELGAEITTLNCHPDGLFPGHPSEPSEKNLRFLSKMVVKVGADIGIAHDGDADRFIAVSSSGRYLNGDMIMAVFIKEIGYRRVVAPVNSSMILDEFAEVERCRVGDANVSQRIKELGYEFGGEQSGTQIFADWRLTPDAIYAAAKFSEIAVKRDVDEIIDSFPEYTTLRENLYYTDRKSMEKRIEEFVKDYDAIRTDGWRINLDELWFLIRFSGTEPKVRITVEALDEKEAEKWMKRILENIGGRK